MQTLNAKTKGTPSVEMSKSNGGKYVLIDCEITDGPAKGLIVAGSFTTVTADGTVKEVPAPETKITLYREVLPSSKEPGKYVNFFNISRGLQQASNDDINALLGVPDEVAKQAL